MTRIKLTVDGATVSDDVEPRMLLVQYLREKLGKTGTVIGCDTSNCGACTVHLDGRSVKSCNVLAVQADGAEVTTIEGLAQDGKLHPVQEAFRECHGLQCGFCTPGMIMQSRRPAQRQPAPDRGGDPARARGQPVPLHRLPQHREVRAARGVGAAVPRRTAGGAAVTADARRRPARTPSAEIGTRPPPQGGPAADHRPHPLDRQHHPAGDAAHGHGAQPVRAREDHQRSTPRRPRPPPNVVDGDHRQGRRRRAGRAAQRVADHPRPGGAAAPADRRRPGRLRRRDRRRGRGPHGRRGPRRRRARGRRLRGAARRARPQGGRGGDGQRGARAPRPRHQQVARSGSSTPRRPAPAATSTRPSRRPAATAS